MDAGSESREVSEYLRANCPVLKGSQEVVDTSQRLVKAMRRLRRDLQGCQVCENGDDCKILEEYNELVKQAILEVEAEFGLI